jgi:hypothetical protein
VKNLHIIKDRAGAAKDNVVWKWTKGAASPPADFGDPVGGDAYALCLLRAGSPVPLLSMAIPGAGICSSGRPCWKVLGSTAFKYSDTAGTSDGVATVLLKPSALAGKAKIIVKAKGSHLRLPAPPIAGSLRVELRATAPGSPCWGADHTSVIRNAPGLLKAKGG